MHSQRQMSQKSSLKSEIISVSVQKQNALIHHLFQAKIKKLQAKLIQYQNGSKYIGQFQEDDEQIMKHGLGKIQTIEGDAFIGDWKFDQRHGNGIEIDRFHNRYEGSYVNNKRNGFGIQKLITGDKYIGQWKNNLKNGKGNQFYSQYSQTYKGNFLNGMRHGKGSYLYRTGDLFEGWWLQDKKQGEGMIIYYNGDIFKGNWRNNIIYGKGTLAYKNGDNFIGFYQNGIRSGNGTYFYLSGDKIQGEWYGDQNCNGVIYYKNGDIYQGSIYKGFREGLGKYFYSTGDVYQGHWSNNQKSGFGQMKKQETTLFSGTWAHNQPVYGKYSDISDSPIKSQKNNINLSIQLQTPQKSLRKM